MRSICRDMLCADVQRVVEGLYSLPLSRGGNKERATMNEKPMSSLERGTASQLERTETPRMNSVPRRRRQRFLPNLMKSYAGLGWRGTTIAVGFMLLVTLAFLLDASGVTWAQGEGSGGRGFMTSLRGGGFIGLVIVLCSIGGFSLAITFAFQIRRDTLIPPDLLDQIEGLLEDEEYEEAFQVCEASDSFLAQVIGAGLGRSDDGYDAMLQAVNETGEMETTKLHQKIGYLSVIASVAPMLGLFGTVYGMIVTFNKIAAAPVAPQPRELADGISIALVTTFLGLLVAIPMTVLFVFFKNRVVNVVLEVGGITEELLSRFKPA